MDKKQILEKLFDKKIIKVLRLLINNPEREFYLREIARLTKVSPATIYRIIKTLKELELVVEKRNKYLKIYSANQKNLSMFVELLEDKSVAMREFVEFMAGISGVKQIILHGEEEKDKANVIIVGVGVSQEQINSKVVEIKERFSFNLIYMFLSPDQYAQMSSMGLFSGKKVILFSI
jgi:DNA-binding MarR family transcriptional regulator